MTDQEIQASSDPDAAMTTPQPSVGRPYVRLETYDISEDADTLNAKLLTSKRGGCDGRHCTKPGQLGSYRRVPSGMTYATRPPRNAKLAVCPLALSGWRTSSNCFHHVRYGLAARTHAACISAV